MTQLDFINDFEAADRDREVREKQKRVTHEIIDQSTADLQVSDRVRAGVTALLHVLADLPSPMKDERGNWLVRVSIKGTLAARLARSRNCVRGYIKRALAIGYLGMLDDCDDDERTYVIYWRSILDREQTQPDATSTASRQDTGSPDANSTVDTGSGGSNAIVGGSPVSRHDGVDLTPSCVEFDPGGGGNLTPVGGAIDPGQTLSSEERLKDVFKAQVKTTSPDVLNVLDAPGGGQSRKAEKPMPLKFWKQWDQAVLVSDLGNLRHVQDLYEMITSMCVMRRCDYSRHRVFATAAMNERMWKSGEAQTRKGLFLNNIAKQFWFYNHLDAMIASRMIHDLDHPVGPSIDARVAAAARVPREHTPSVPPPQPSKTLSLVADLAEAWGVVEKFDSSEADDSPSSQAAESPVS